MNQAIKTVAIAVLAVVTWTGCGGGGSSSNTNQTKPVSNIQNRLWVTNSQTGYIELVDVAKDQLTPPQYWTNNNGNPTFMVATPNGRNVAVFDSTFNSVALMNTDKEDRITKVQLGNWTESMAISSEAKWIYAAVRNFANAAPTLPGAVQAVDAQNAFVQANYPVSNVHYLALNHAGTKLLAFSDTIDTPFLIDLTAANPTATPVPGPFSRPVAAYFTDDDTKAYVLSCGLECGGSQASVVELTMSNLSSREVAVPAATIGALDGTNLYVAGAPGGSGGTISVVDTTSMTVSSTQMIGNGSHKVMKIGGGKVWVGARGCGGGGCLSVFDPTSGTVVVDDPAPGAASKGDVTGMDFNTPTNRMYVCEGGELYPYDPSGAELPTLIDIVGYAYDVHSLPPPQ